MNPSHNPNPPSHTDASEDAQHRHLEVAEGRFRDLLESVMHMNQSDIDASGSETRRPSNPSRLTDFQRYGLAVVSVGVALGASLVLEHFHFREPAAPLLLFAVAISSWYGGPGPALLAVILCTASFYWYFVRPVHTIYIYPSEIPYFIIFVAFASLISWFSAIRRRAEEALREQANLLNLTYDAICVTDMEGVIKYWNRGAEERYGWMAEQAVGRVVHDLLKTELPAPLEQIKAEVVRTGRWEGELLHTEKDGTQIVVASRWALQRDEQGAPVAILETNNNITERKRAEKELADRFRFETLLAELSARFVHVPAEQIDGEIKDAQRRVCESLGLDACSLWQVMPETPSFIPLTHIYRPTAGAPIPEAINAGQYLPWSTQQILAGKIIVVSSLEELPTEAARDRQTFGFFGIKSVLTLGLSVGGGPVVGGLAFSSRTARTWPQELVKRLQTVAELFCSGLERQRSERALRESEERFRSLFENATVGIYRTTPQGSILMANPTLVRMLGFKSFEELAARNLEKDGFEPNYPRRLFRERIEKESEVRGMEEAWTRQDGSVIFVRESAQAIRGEDGSIEYHDGVVEDITERKRAEEALRDSERELRQALLAADMGVWEWTAAADAVTWDENLYRIAGRDTKLPPLSYQEHSQVFAPESLERLTRAVEDCLRSGTPYGLDMEMIRPDGSKRWVIGRGEARRDSGGHITGLRGTVQDITERKRAEAALQASEKGFRTLMEMAPVAIVINRAGQTLYVNRRCLEMYGCESTEEVVGRPVLERWSPEWRPIIEERARQRAQGLFVPTQYEGIGQRKDGSRFPVEMSVAAVTLPDGGANIAFLTDITERKRAEEEKQQFLEQLRALAVRLQSTREEESKRLAREIHDQVGQALTALKFDVISLLGELPGGSQPWSRRVSSIETLINQTIHTVGHISSELRPGTLDHLGLAATVEWAGEDFERRTGIKCRLDVPEEELALDSGRATAIYRILQELLTNVARHAAATEVEIELLNRDHDVILTVRDNGKGMPAEKLSAKESLGILGMQERALAFGGELLFCSAPGAGTTVRVRIPQ
jgi:PAS domain S-box-containing protein